MILHIENLLVRRVDDVNGRVFELHVPEFAVGNLDRVCLVGKSGSGKSTLLETVALLLKPDGLSRFDLAPFGDGRFLNLCSSLLQGRTSDLSSIRAQTMGFVMQDGGLLPYLSVRENARLAANLSAKSKAQDIGELIETMAESLGLSEYLDRLPAKLSGGQRQRGAVLRALATLPRVLVADEPTASLDPETADDVLELMTQSARAIGASVLVASHDEQKMRKHGFDICPVVTDETKELSRSSIHRAATQRAMEAS